MTSASGKAEGGNVAEALAEAVAAIYFDDSSDYSSALWAVARILGGQAVADLLESDRRAAYEKYVEQQGSTPLTCYVNTPDANGPGEADGWLPIESAPKDGTYVLAYCGDDFQSVCYWSTSIWVNGGAWIYDECRSDTVQLEPTHWRPLPAPPGASESTPQPGMVTVPREPTEAMLDAAIAWRIALKVTDSYSMRDQFADCYRAMLDAALRSGEMGR